MDIAIIFFLSVVITVYPLIKLDEYCFNKKIELSSNKFVFIIQNVFIFILSFGWLILSCYISFRIVKFIGL